MNLSDTTKSTTHICINLRKNSMFAKLVLPFDFGNHGARDSQNTRDHERRRHNSHIVPPDGSPVKRVAARASSENQRRLPRFVRLSFLLAFIVRLSNVPSLSSSPRKYFCFKKETSAASSRLSLRRVALQSYSCEKI